jgi:hypothetical protein
MTRHNERIIRTFLPEVPVYLERDTVRWYVSADSSGIVTGDIPVMQERVYVRDIREDDEVSLSLHSVLHEGVFTSGDIVQVGGRTAFGAMHHHTVSFPLTAAFPRTGMYHINLIARARRVHETASGKFEYRGTFFDTTLVPRSMIASLERSGISLSVHVVDTSIREPKTLEALSLEAERSAITSAVGFEETNVITGNLGWSGPDVRIIRGGGRLEKTAGAARKVQYRWIGTVSTVPDSVVIESRLQRQAGGKDIARTAFTVSGSEPYLRTPLPGVLYAGEDLRLDIGVAGLDDDGAYSWSLFEAAGEDDLLLKGEGRGARVQYRIPNSYGGKRLVVDARYHGRRYRYISSQTYAAGQSRFVLPVQEPPTQIVLDIPARASVMESFRFTASRYVDARFRGEQPIDRLSDVRVEIRDEENNRIRTDVSMIRKGAFAFIIQDKDLIRASGERVIVQVHAAEATVQTIMELYR